MGTVHFTDINTPDNWQIVIEDGQVGMHEDCCCGSKCPNGRPELHVSMSWTIDPVGLPNYHDDSNYTVSVQNVKGECTVPVAPATEKYIEWCGHKWCNGQTIYLCPTVYECGQYTQTWATYCKEHWSKTCNGGRVFNFQVKRGVEPSIMFPSVTHKFGTVGVEVRYGNDYLNFLASRRTDWTTSNSWVYHTGLAFFWPTSAGNVVLTPNCPVNMTLGNIDEGYVQNNETLKIEWEYKGEGVCPRA